MRCPPLILAEEAFRDLTIGAIIIQVHIYDKYTTLAYRLPYYILSRYNMARYSYVGVVSESCYEAR
jgi:hypothetical protein